MNFSIIHDKNILFDFLRKEAGLQIYLIGDLDDFFWPKTSWYALEEDGHIKAVALLYCGMSPATLLCFQKEGSENASRLLHEIRHLLPVRFYAHLGEGLTGIFGRRNILEHYGLNYKMVCYRKIDDPGNENIMRLTMADLPEIGTLYREAYPHNWFDPRMLESGKYFGYILNDRLVGIAGIHVYSATYKVAALGNIATMPEFRRRGIGYLLTATLCHDLQKDVDTIGLNVRSGNRQAIQLYESLGFRIEGTYEESLLQNVPQG